MGGDKPVRRMTLRQLLSHSEKCARDLIEVVRTGYLSQICDFRELCRPVAMHNSLKKLQEAAQHTQELTETLKEQLETVRDHVNRDRVNRL